MLSTPVKSEKQHGDGKPLLTWKGVSMLMLSDIVGTSVLTFPSVAARLGWVLTILFIIGLFPVSVYISVLMARTCVRSNACIHSMGSAGHQIFGRRAGQAIYVAVYGFTLLGNASYLLVVGTSIQGIFYENSTFCLYTAVALGCLFLSPIVVSIRRLRESVLLCFVNLLLILAVVFIAIATLSANGRHPCVRTYAFARDLTTSTVFEGATNLVYAYAGQWMYFEIMAEMHTPEDFTKAFTISGPVMLSLYLLVACVGYYYLGEAATGSLVENMPTGPAYAIAQTLLFLHVAIVYVIKSVVLARFCHLQAFPRTADKRTAESYGHAAVFGISMLAFGFCVANAIPFFDDLLGLLGGFLSGPINFLLPILFYFGSLLRSMSENEPEGAVPGRLWSVVSRHLSLAGRVFLLIVVCFILLTMGLGTYSTIVDIVRKSGTFGGPFTCHPLQTVNASGLCHAD